MALIRQEDRRGISFLYFLESSLPIVSAFGCFSLVRIGSFSLKHVCMYVLIRCLYFEVQYVIAVGALYNLVECSQKGFDTKQRYLI